MSHFIHLRNAYGFFAIPSSDYPMIRIVRIRNTQLLSVQILIQEVQKRWCKTYITKKISIQCSRRKNESLPWGFNGWISGVFLPKITQILETFSTTNERDMFYVHNMKQMPFSACTNSVYTILWKCFKNLAWCARHRYFWLII